ATVRAASTICSTNHLADLFTRNLLQHYPNNSCLHDAVALIEKTGRLERVIVSSDMLLDKIRLAPEQMELKAAMDQFNLSPVISNFEQTGGLRSVRDAVLATNLQISEVMSPRLFNLLHGVRSRLKFE